MKYGPLLWSTLTRRRGRTIFSLLSLAVAFLLYGYLGAIVTAFDRGPELAGRDRLVVTNKVSMIQPLPIAYQDQLTEVDGVAAAGHLTFFGGIYKNPRNFFVQTAVDPASWQRLYPEYIVPPDQLRAWATTRAGAIAGRRLAARFQWHIGDRIPLQGTLWRPRGLNVWNFELVGIYDAGDPGADTRQLFVRYDYVDANRTWGRGQVGWYVVAVKDPAAAGAVANRIDHAFANSPAETRTSSERAFVQTMANQIGNVGAIAIAILSAAFFTVLLVTGTTIGDSVRERSNEIAVLKSLGFTDQRILVLVLSESFLLAGAGGGFGLAVAAWLIRRGDPTGGGLPAFALPSSVVGVGVVFILALGFLAGAIPAVRATQLRIAEALRRA